MTHYDAIVIGAGQAGPPLAEKLTDNGLRCALIERKDFGGTCVNVGCIPTKTLVGSARIAQLARRSREYGVETGEVKINMPAVMARMNKIRGDSNAGVRQWLESMDALDVIRGHARFTGRREISVEGQSLTADRIFVNAGARARVPDIDGLQNVPYFTNSNILDIDFVPEHLIIIGGSYIGLEFAQVLRRFGSAVTVIEMAERIIAREDEDVSAAIQDILEQEGVRIELGATCISVRQTGRGIEAAADCDDGERKIRGSHLLIATGRQPNVDDLCLERAGVELDERGFIQVDDELRSSAEGIWALGEVNGKGAFTHTAYNDFEIVAANLFSERKRKVSDRIDVYGLFVDPPLGRAGMTEKAARAAGHRVRVGKRPMTRVGRAREFGETQGFMKIVVDADTDRVLGAALLGLSGDEVVHTIIDVMNADLPYTAITRAVHIHPTVAELIPTVLGELSDPSS